MPTLTDEALMDLLAELAPRPHAIDAEFPPARRTAVISEARQRSVGPAAVRFTSRHNANRRLSARRPLAAVAGLGVAAALTTVALLAPSGEGPHPIPAALDQLATTAARTSALPQAGPHGYLYRQERISETTPTSERDYAPRTDVSIVRLWTRGDGDQYRAESAAHFRSAFHFVPHGPADFAAPNRRFLAALPASPRALYVYLRRHVDGGKDRSDAVFNALRDMLLSGVPTPHERAAMIRTLGLLPRVKVKTNAVDPSGRTTVRVDYQTDDATDSLYFDPIDSHLTAEADLWTSHGHRYGTRTVVVRSEVVTRPPTRVINQAQRVG